jgi:RNA polymerase sigma factor (sigma-70 family)
MSPRLPIRLLAAQSDRRLVELVETGHERAFEVLVHRYRRQLLRYCGRLGLSDARAEDVLQQAFLRAWLALERGSEVHELKAWLYRIVHNTAVNAMRGVREDHAPLPDVAEITLVAPIENDFEQRTALRDTLADVAALPPMQRDAILLSAIDGRSHQEVASALGITHGAVRGLLYRARASLRSAAAALTPPPLLAWAAGSSGRLAPAASRLAELSGAASGSDAGGALLKGVAVALTSAAAAGAVLVPLPHHHARNAHRAALASSALGVSEGRPSAAAAAPLALLPPGAAEVRRRSNQSSGSAHALARTRVSTDVRERSGSHRGDLGSRGSASDGHSGTHRGGDGAPSGSLAHRDDSRASGPSGSGDGGSLPVSSGSGTSGSGTSSRSGDSHTDGSGDGGSAEREAEATRERSEREVAAQREREAQAAAVSAAAGTDS